MSEDNMNTTDNSLRDAHEELVRRGDKIASHFTYWFAWFWGVVSVVYFFAVTFFPLPPDGVNFANIGISIRNRSVDYYQLLFWSQ